ncbi:GNAT family N-acetyltransferase [Reyranella sp.]|uniref:GNAT family N-acetyltransferase n=1 Tax=Reyranella sp. TaxID=1929291 RepID=UPI003D0DB95E
MLIVEACPLADMFAAASFPQLAAEYARESLIDGMPQPAPDWNAYAALEAAGLLHGFAASVDGELVGFITVLRAKPPRYAAPVAVTESFFVARAHRRTGAGLKLLRAAEDKARALGVPALLVSAPSEGVLAQVLPRRGYAETNRVFFKELTDA